MVVPVFLFSKKAGQSGLIRKRGEILVKINGEEQAVAGQTVAEYLEKAGYCRTRVAVKRNGEIIPKAEYDYTVLNEGDAVEVVSFVGGG